MEALPAFTPEVVDRLIEQVSFFKNFTVDERAFVLNYMQAFLRFAPSEVIISAESVDNQAMYVLLSGSAVITAAKNNVQLDQVRSGEFFGEISFLTDMPRIANVLALESCILWRIDHELLQEAPIALREKIKDKIIAKLVREVTHTNTQFAECFV